MKAVRLHRYHEQPTIEQVDERKITGPHDVIVRIGGAWSVPYRSAHHRGTVGREIRCDSSLHAGA